MLNKNEVINVFKVGIVLFLITAIATALLAIVNATTSPIIEKNEKEKQEVAMRVVLPKANNFEEITTLPAKVDESVAKIYQGDNDSGYVVLAYPKGYGGEISMVVGVSLDGKVSGVSITSQSETAGLGAKCTNSDFLMQYTNKTQNISVTKQGASGNAINAISSATITSKAVTKGVNAAIEAAKLAKEAE